MPWQHSRYSVQNCFDNNRLEISCLNCGYVFGYHSTERCVLNEAGWVREENNIGYDINLINGGLILTPTVENAKIPCLDGIDPIFGGKK